MDFEIHKDEALCSGIKESLSKNKCDTCSQCAEFLTVVESGSWEQEGPPFVFEI